VVGPVRNIPDRVVLVHVQRFHQEGVEVPAESAVKAVLCVSLAGPLGVAQMVEKLVANDKFQVRVRLEAFIEAELLPQPQIGSVQIFPCTLLQSRT